jgi:hypothetical protein
MTLTNIFWEPATWKTVMADWLKKKLLLDWQTVWLEDLIDSTPEALDELLSFFVTKSSIPQNIIIVSIDKIVDKRIDYYVETINNNKYL